MSNLDQVIPLGFNVLCEVLVQDKEELKTKSGIILTTQYADKIKYRGELLKIVKIGAEAFTNCFGNKEIVPEIGSFCFVKQNSGYLLQIDGKDYRFIPSECIISVIPEGVVQENYQHINS